MSTHCRTIPAHLANFVEFVFPVGEKTLADAHCVFELSRRIALKEAADVSSWVLRKELSAAQLDNLAYWALTYYARTSACADLREAVDFYLARYTVPLIDWVDLALQDAVMIHNAITKPPADIEKRWAGETHRVILCETKAYIKEHVMTLPQRVRLEASRRIIYDCNLLVYALGYLARQSPCEPIKTEI